MIILVAIGNTLRRDDGAAHRVLELLGETRGLAQVFSHQLTPEMAEDIAAARVVVFVYADRTPGEARLEPLELEPSPPFVATHFLHPTGLVELARRLFEFSGDVCLCRVPGQDFSAGFGLSAYAEANAQVAAELLRRFCVSAEFGAVPSRARTGERLCHGAPTVKLRS